MGLKMRDNELGLKISLNKIKTKTGDKDQSILTQKKGGI
jgi:hypothetical protein